MGTTASGKAVQSGDLVDAAQLLDDCLIRIFPEEFTQEHRDAAAQRFFDGGGTIGRIATMADKLRQATNAPRDLRGGSRGTVHADVVPGGENL